MRVALKRGEKQSESWKAERASGEAPATFDRRRGRCRPWRVSTRIADVGCCGPGDSGRRWPATQHDRPRPGRTSCTVRCRPRCRFPRARSLSEPTTWGSPCTESRCTSCRSSAASSGACDIPWSCPLPPSLALTPDISYGRGTTAEHPGTAWSRPAVHQS